MDRKYTDLIVIHCSYTKPSMDHVNEDVIRQWHIEKGWEDAGYNIVIPRKAVGALTGLVEIARPMDARGAHVAGFNHRALGICMVGGMSEDGYPEDNFLPEQYEMLATSVYFALMVYPKSVVVGHRDLNSAKECPCFDAQMWAKDHGFPTP